MLRSILFVCVCAVLVYGCSSSSDNSGSTTGAAKSSATTTQANGSAPSGAYAAVQTIFTNNCMPCHGGGSRGPAGGVDLSSYDGVIKGGRSGPVVVAGDPAGSKLVKMISGPTPSMPKNKPPLSASDVKTISDWIQAGAKNG